MFKLEGKHRRDGTASGVGVKKHTKNTTYRKTKTTTTAAAAAAGGGTADMVCNHSNAELNGTK